MAQEERQYECIVFGATGYTGNYTAEHITSNLPTDFKWAVAGRSEAKLKRLVEELKTLNPDRVQPGVELTQLKKDDLVRLAKKTKVLITTVGPYHQYGDLVFEACAETGTHYLDVTGEVPWVLEMTTKYHDTAKRTGAIMIPQNGIESAPMDLICWMLVSYVRRTLDVGTAELIHSIYDFKATASGGTLATALSIFDKYSMSEFAKAQQPWCLCPIPPPKQHSAKPIFERVTGLRSVSDLGTMTDSIQGPTDIPIAHRSWGLYDGGKFYGPNFHVSAYMRTRNALTGFGFHIVLLAGLLALALSPTRWLMKFFVYQPGDGPTKEQGNNEFIEWRAIANADVAGSQELKRAYGRMRWEGSMYHLTGVCLAEAALILAREKTLAHELGGGVLTPATLGQRYLTQLEKSGLKTEVKMLT